MDEKSQVLFTALKAAYADPEVKMVPELTQLIVKTATILDTDEDSSYQQAVTHFSREVATYYVMAHSLPVSLNKLYHQVQVDVLPAELDEADLRRYALAAGLVALPIMFGGN